MSAFDDLVVTNIHQRPMPVMRRSQMGEVYAYCDRLRAAAMELREQATELRRQADELDKSAAAQEYGADVAEPVPLVEGSTGHVFPAPAQDER